MPRHSTATAKPRDTKYVLKRLWKYLYNYKWLLLTAIVLTLAAKSFEVFGPTLSGKAIAVTVAAIAEIFSINSNAKGCVLIS